MISGIRLAMFISCLTLLASPARARTWIVAADGSGDFALLSAAYAAAASGDTVLIRPGHYQEPDHDGCEDQVIRIDQKSMTTIGTGASPSDVSITLMLVFDSCQEASVQNVWFHDTWRPLTIISTGITDRATVRDCLFEDNGHECGKAALLMASWNGLVERCSFRRNWCTSVYEDGGALLLYSEGHIVVRDCAFEDNIATGGGGAIEAFGPGHVVEGCVFLRNAAARGGAVESRNIEIRNCSFWDNQGDGAIYLDGSNGDNLHNCIVAGTHGGPGVRCGPMHFSGTPWCCDLWANEGQEWCASGGTGNFSLDPMFCNPDAGDLTLRDGSPCIDGTAGGYNCGQIGAEGVGCGESPTQPVTWGRLKSIFR